MGKRVEKKEIKIETVNKVLPEVYTRNVHTVSRKNIDQDALKVMRRLMRNGYKAYLVGGAVRDLLLGKRPKDFDIATDATPRRVKSLFRNCRIIGRRFKLAHIYFGNGKIFEVSTFRASHDEITADELNAEDFEDHILLDDNVYGDECSDALRRDITINALFYSLKDFSVIDYTGGMRDLQAGIVRVIGDPEVRFIEDPVRMVRVVRHAVRAGFKLEESCIAALNDRHQLLDQCSPARLYEEIRKDLVSGYAWQIFSSYHQYSILQHLLPELVAAGDEIFMRGSLFERCFKQIDEYVAETGIETTTAMFAVMFLLLVNTSRIGVAERFSARSEIADFVFSCFKSVVVPRKERERIVEILDIIRILESENLRLAEFRRLTHRSAFEDTKLVLSFVNVEENVQVILDTIKILSKQRNSFQRNSTQSRRNKEK